MKKMDKSLGSSITKQEADLVKELCKNFNEIDHPERKKEWLETIHTQILAMSVDVPSDFDFYYKSNDDRIRELRDRNYPCLDKSK